MPKLSRAGAVSTNALLALLLLQHFQSYVFPIAFLSLRTPPQGIAFVEKKTRIPNSFPIAIFQFSRDIVLYRETSQTQYGADRYEK